MPTYALSKKTVLGVAMETLAAPGTPISTPTLFVPTKHTYKRVVKKTYVTDDRGVRDDNNDVVVLVYEGQHSLKGEFYADTSPYFIIAALGLDTATQPNVGTAPTAWQHLITPADIPPTMTLFKSYQTEKYQMPFSVVTKMSFKYTNETSLMFDCDLTSNSHVTPPYTGTGFNTITISNVHPMAGALATVKYGGATSNNIDNIEIDYEQKYTLWYSGNRDYITAYPEGRAVKFKFDARFDSPAIYDDFVANNLSSLEFNIQGINLGGTVYQMCDVQLPVTSYDSMDHETSKANVQIKVAGTAMPSAGANLINVTVINTVASYTV